MVLNSTKQPVTGVYCFYDTNGNVLAETPFKNGKKEGIQKVYFESGKLWMENPYKNGNRSRGTFSDK